MELFDNAIASSLAFRNPAFNAPNLDTDALHRELAALRQKTHKNMHFAKAFMLPMAQYAWSGIAPLPEPERIREARRLLKITHRLTGFLDETLIHAATECRDETPQIVNLREVLEFSLSASPDLAGKVVINGAQRFATVQANWAQMLMLFNELCRDCVSHAHDHKSLSIRFDCPTDKMGNPVLRMIDNGRSLSERRAHMLATAKRVGAATSAPVAEGFAMSLVQRLAELNGGEFRVKDGDSEGCVTMIKFPKDPKSLQ